MFVLFYSVIWSKDLIRVTEMALQTLIKIETQFNPYNSYTNIQGDSLEAPNQVCQSING